MDVPSGSVFSEHDLGLVRLMKTVGFLQYSETPFTLKSGVQSHIYVFGREDLTDNIGFEYKLGLAVAQRIADLTVPGSKQPCLIGLPTAGTAIAQAAAMVTHNCDVLGGGNQPLYMCHRIMRETLKQHGAHQKWVNGDPDYDRHQYWWVDNVATNGDTKIEAEEKVVTQGYHMKEDPCLITVDRQQGAVDRLYKAGFKHVIVLYELLDLTYALAEMNLWPKDVVKKVEEEIKAHQF